jgi:hypothetical protein
LASVGFAAPLGLFAPDQEGFVNTEERDDIFLEDSWTIFQVSLPRKSVIVVARSIGDIVGAIEGRGDDVSEIQLIEKKGPVHTVIIPGDVVDRIHATVERTQPESTAKPTEAKS